ncbi:DUF5325 family protein [Paenibacillus radicis (ex Gao et al. 2016)]|uniref:DUF5325 family protein n=1 Tax=Paenibacillus radicis (ex Gao et al. 2016) TaxID=1737354 RepID=A0A917LXB5_9BACL|nr:DUF5325 family protein [Paenibacillus radicis (ex Gao et al. 2016)]GGG63879.1 hypothetical protein GCM10010918_17360 [Paenibacillus radicis (ex Gao et al. 2016)]
MSKPMSLLFAVLSVLFMLATAVSISINGWLALLMAVLTLFMIGSGFIVKARLRRRG